MRGKRIEANWQGIRDSIVAGMTYREASKRFNVSSTCIRKRASREHWPTPTPIQQTIEECKAKQHALIKGDAQSIATWQNNVEQCASDGQSQVSQAAVSQLPSDSTAEIIGQNWFEKGEVHRRLAFEIATKALQLIQNGRGELPPLEQWSDIEKADKMARRSAGLDSDASVAKVNVALNLVNQRILAMREEG